ncbi:MAG: peptidylprolyl isomerase [Elusimicrobia bacterium]|jgi:parvulin-like peptidyl-prolyl isomerase|nr:peptidylprolyl isomerase [Elusimicrobiota bacterium]
MRARYFIVIPLLVGLACKKSDPVLAQVGSRSVTASDFLKEVAGVPFTSQAYLQSPSGRKELLELLVRRKIILEETESRPPSPETKELLKKLTTLFKEKQKELRQSFGEEKERLLVSQYTKTLKEGPLKVTEDEVHAFWEKGVEVQAAHILVSDRTLAESLLKKISGGEKFDVLAKNHSEDPASAAKGGDAGYLLPGSLVPEFENALFQMSKGETSGIVVSPYGFHLIRRGNDRALSAQPFNDELKTRLRQTLESQKLQAWFESIRQRHPAKINNEALSDIVFPAPPMEIETP